MRSTSQQYFGRSAADWLRRALMEPQPVTIHQDAAEITGESPSGSCERHPAGRKSQPDRARVLHAGLSRRHLKIAGFGPGKGNHAHRPYHLSPRATAAIMIFTAISSNSQALGGGAIQDNRWGSNATVYAILLRSECHSV